MHTQINFAAVPSNQLSAKPAVIMVENMKAEIFIKASSLSRAVDAAASIAFRCQKGTGFGQEVGIALLEVRVV